MEFSNALTSEFAYKRGKIWEEWHLTSKEQKNLHSELEQIIAVDTNLSISIFSQFDLFPPESKEVYSKIASRVDKSNEHKERISNLTSQLMGKKREIEQVDRSITNVEKEISDSEELISNLNSKITIGWILILLIIPFFLIQGWKKDIIKTKSKIDSCNTKKQNLLQNKQSHIKEVKELNDQIEEEKNVITQIKNECLQLSSELMGELASFYKGLLEQHWQKVYEDLRKLAPFKHHFWTIECWKTWDVNQIEIAQDLCVGHYLENKSEDLTFELPAYIPFIGQQKAVFLTGNNDHSSSINGLMEAMAIRIAMMLPHKAKFTFIDPSGFGKAFPISGRLETRESSGDVYRVLENVMDDMQRTISKYGLSDDRPFDFEPENILVEQRFEFIFAADFPKQYDRRVIESLTRIANTGHIAGKYVIIHHNHDVELPRDISMNDFENRFELDMQDLVANGGDSYLFVPDVRPVDKLKLQLLETLKTSKPKQKKIEWKDEVALVTEDWWKSSAIENIETPIGRSGRSDKLDIWFGAKQNEGGRPCSHGMLGAMTGSGKSNLYHVLILGLAIRYSPKELAFYLIDGKDGVEFQPYKYLPHAEFVSLKSQPKLSRSILAELLEEKERRNELFTKYQVNDYESYRKLDETPQVLPRILLMVDEYQELFEGDKEGVASNHLLALAQQGRSAGIHMLLGSQRFGVVGIMHQSAIFGNIHLRIAMKMSLSDRQSLTEFGREGKQEIADCNLPGKAVINDQSGDDGANKPGMVALMTKVERNNLINEISRKAQMMDGVPVELLTTNIFHGSEQPNMLDNPQLNYLARNDKWFSDLEMQEFANKEVHEGGLGEISWFVGEKPVAGWLGQEFNVRGQTKVILRRRQRENILILGDYNEGRFGILTSLLTSFALMSPPENNQFYIIDKTIPGAPWNTALKHVEDQLLKPIGLEVKLTTKNSESENTLNELAEVLEKRLQQDEDERSEFNNVYLCIADPDKLESLCHTPNKYGNMEDSKLGKILQEIFVKGPSVGIFTIMAVESVISCLSVISKRNMDYFRHRVALQMSEDDSFTYIKRREASKLQVEGKKPICGFYLDVSNNRHSIFKSYCLGEEMNNQINEIRELLKTR